MKKTAIAIAHLILLCVYKLFLLLPQRDEIVCISRQANTPSVDFRLIAQEVEICRPEFEVVFLTKTLAFLARI